MLVLDSPVDLQIISSIVLRLIHKQHRHPDPPIFTAFHC